MEFVRVFSKLFIQPIRIDDIKAYLFEKFKIQSNIKHSRNYVLMLKALICAQQFMNIGLVHY
jgi:hypothetical protein